MWTRSGNWCSTPSSLTRHNLAVLGDCFRRAALSRPHHHSNVPWLFQTENSNGAFTPSDPPPQGLRVKLKMILGKLPQKGHQCSVTALQGYFFWPYSFLMPPMILLQRAELWELRAGLGANRAWRVWRFRHGQVRWCMEQHAKTPPYDSLHVGRVGVDEGACSQSC